MATGAAGRSHPHLHQPLLYVSRLPAQTTDNELAELLRECLPVRLGIKRDDAGPDGLVDGTIEFREFAKAEKALATLSTVLYLSPYPPPFLPLPPSADSLPRVAGGFADGASAGDVWEALRPMSLREVRPLQRSSWADPSDWLVEFWFEDDARHVEEHPPQLPSGQVLSLVPYNPRRSAATAAAAASAAAAAAAGGLPTTTTTLPAAVRPPPLPSTQYYTPSHSRSPSFGFTTTPLSPLSAGAPSFVPSANASASGSPRQPTTAGRGSPALWSPSTQAPVDLASAGPGSPYAGGLGLGLGPLGSPTGLGINTFGPGQQVQPAPVVGPGSTSASGLIDPCNLFCKNLDPNLNSQDLFNAFRTFGQIVSARVMKDEMGISKGFGFVSYHHPGEAHQAMATMDGKTIGEKAIVVRLHEPKRVRAEKLAEQRAKGLAGLGGMRGAMSPLARCGDLPEPGLYGEGFGHDRRRSSGSASGGGGGGGVGSYQSTPARRNDVDELVSLTPDRRRGILTAELHKRVGAMPSVPRPAVDAVVKALVELDLGVIPALKSPDLLEEKVHGVLGMMQSDERLAPLAPPDLLRTSTPSEISRTASPATERERLSAAVARLETDERVAADILEMILSLKKKDRALCLFNSDFLEEKVAEAKEVLAMQDDEDDDDRGMHRKSRAGAAEHATSPERRLKDQAIAAPQRAHSAPIEPGTPLSPRSAAQKASQLGLVAASTPASPAGSSVRASSDASDRARPDVQSLEAAAAAIDLDSDISPAPPKTVGELAALSAKDAVAYLREEPSRAMTSVGQSVDATKSREMGLFLDGLEGKQPAQQKQSLGERLFKLIRSWDPPRSIKAPKVTIHLLDSEDLHALGFLLSDYPLVLREKVALAAGLPTWPTTTMP